MIVVDTGVLFAAADDRDGDHAACAELLDTHRAADRLVPATVIHRIRLAHRRPSR